jgi:hypothetical protein
MAAPASATVLGKRKHEAGGSGDSLIDYLTQLPNVLVLHIAAMLASVDLLAVRRVCKTTYALNYGPSYQFPVGLKFLSPGMLSQSHWQSSGSTKHLALSLSWPMPQDEIASLSELRMFSKLKQLSVEFHGALDLEAGDEHDRALALTRARVRETVDLGLQSLTFTPDDDEYGIDLFWDLILLNRQTLQHIDYQGDVFQDALDNAPHDVIDVLRKLVLFRSRGPIPDMLYDSDDGVPDLLPSQADMPPHQTWQYLDLSTDFKEQNFAFLPVHPLPSSLIGARLWSNEKALWQCPDSMQCLEIATGSRVYCDMRRLLPIHFPPTRIYAKLECLSLGLGMYKNEVKSKELDNAFAEWLNHVSFPILHTLDIEHIATNSEVTIVIRFVAHLPALRTLHVHYTSPAFVHTSKTKAARDATLDVLRVIMLDRGVAIHVDSASPTLYDDLLRRNKVPLLPHSKSFIANGATHEVLHLRPTAHRVVRPRHA